MGVEERLRAVFVLALDLAPDADLSRVRQWVEPTWDSMGHAALVTAVEGEFGIELEPEDVVRIDSFEAALALVRARGVDA